MKKLLLIGSIVASVFAIEPGNYSCILAGYQKNGIMYKSDKTSGIDLKVTNDSVFDGTDTYKWFAEGKGQIFYKNTEKGIISISEKTVNGVIPVMYVPKSNDILLVLGCIKKEGE